MALLEGKPTPFMFFEIVLTVGSAVPSLRKFLYAGLKMARRGSKSLRAGLRA